mgnify:CR=1 FL=1
MLTLTPVSRRSLRDLQREVDSLFDSIQSSARASRSDALWTPRTDLVDTEAAFHLHVDLPGVSRDDLSIDYEDRTLVISGTRSTDLPDGDLVRSERASGSFRRTVSLPRTVDVNAIEASYENGVLTVTLPKTEASRPRRIDVQ